MTLAYDSHVCPTAKVVVHTSVKQLLLFVLYYDSNTNFDGTYADMCQWRSSAPKSGGGGAHKLFSRKVKSKKKKKGHSGVLAHDRVL